MINKGGKPICDLETWRRLAGPKKPEHWKDGRSAKESARAWLERNSDCVPTEIDQAFRAHPDFGRILPGWSAEPEARVTFDSFGGEPSNLDVLLTAEDEKGPLVIAVEAKADETFGKTVEDTLQEACKRKAKNPQSRGVDRLEQLVLCRRDSFAKSLDFREDGIGRSRPHERVCVGVPFGRVAFDALDELRHLAERIAPNRLAGKDIEPDLHLIEPRSIGGGVVNVKSGTPCQPSLDLGLLMRGVVVDDEMNIEVSGDVGLDGAQELKELLVTMTGLALGHHFPGGYVQGGKSGWWCHGACNRA